MTETDRFTSPRQDRDSSHSRCDYRESCEIAVDERVVPAFARVFLALTYVFSPFPSGDRHKRTFSPRSRPGIGADVCFLRVAVRGSAQTYVFSAILSRDRRKRTFIRRSRPGIGVHIWGIGDRVMGAALASWARHSLKIGGSPARSNSSKTKTEGAWGL